MLQEMRRDAGLTVPELIALIVLIVILGFIALPGLHITCCQRASNDRQAAAGLKTLAQAEADFRANDRDGNRINDFWTGDVKSLYTLTSAAMPGAKLGSTSDPSIKLIEISVAGADADGTFLPAGGENLAMTEFTVLSPKAGYWYAAMHTDPRGALRQDRKFAFTAFPDTPTSGKVAFIMDETGTLFRAPTTGACRIGSATPPGLSNVDSAYLSWPDEKTLKSHWSKVD